MASRKLKHYFTAHPITVPTSHPIRDVFENREAIGRISKWAAEIAPYALAFTARTAIKSQALADFVADWTRSGGPEELPIPEPVWEAHVDGAWGAAGAGAAAILTSPSGQRLRYAARLDFPYTNNVAEYEALVLALRKATALGARRLVIRSDSQVVAQQVEKEYLAREPVLARYLQLVRSLERKFQGFTVTHIPRADNAEADALAKATAQRHPVPPEVFFTTTQSRP
ncbi:unnamed protein product [Urochloa humidicola]